MHAFQFIFRKKRVVSVINVIVNCNKINQLTTELSAELYHKLQLNNKNVEVTEYDLVAANRCRIKALDEKKGVLLKCLCVSVCLSVCDIVANKRMALILMPFFCLKTDLMEGSLAFNKITANLQKFMKIFRAVYEVLSIVIIMSGFSNSVNP